MGSINISIYKDLCASSRKDIEIHEERTYKGVSIVTFYG